VGTVAILLVSGVALWSWKGGTGGASALSPDGFIDWLDGGGETPQDRDTAGGRRQIPQVNQLNGAAAPPLADWMHEAGLKVPSTREELDALVAWLRNLPTDELLLLSNAEYGFAESELVDMLHELAGSWVVPALGDLAVAEGDTLLKAILVEGLVGTGKWERFDDPSLLPVLDSLMGQLSQQADDPWEVGHGLAWSGYLACASQGADYVALTATHLQDGTNPDLLIQGYMWMGRFANGKQTLRQMLLGHASDEGRMGALEGLRHGGGEGKHSEAEITGLGLAALDAEENPRNRLLLYEMMVSAGGDEGLQAVEDLARAASEEDLARMAGLLAGKMEPDRAMALFQESMVSGELDPETELALYRAIGQVAGEESLGFLLDRVTDPELGEEERLRGLQGLWNRPMDDALGSELRALVDGECDPALRTEALRMLVGGSEGEHGVDLREVGAMDTNAEVRAEAVMLAAFEPGEDHRAWLEQRMVEDDSLDVKAAALGALVYHAHYAGDGDHVLGYLDEASRFTNDEEALAMIERGRTMVRNHDPRRLDLELAKEAEFYGKIAALTGGAASRQFERQARQLQRMVTALRRGGESAD